LAGDVCCGITYKLLKLFGFAVKKAAKKSRKRENNIYLIHVGMMMLHRLVKVLCRGDGGGMGDLGVLP
jgi:hypothetical protein